MYNNKYIAKYTITYFKHSEVPYHDHKRAYASEQPKL